MDITCLLCNQPDPLYSKKRQLYICEDCGHEFAPEEPFMHFLTPVNFAPLGPVITTAVRLWLFGDANAHGHWDDNLTALCLWCGKRFTV